MSKYVCSKLASDNAFDVDGKRVVIKGGSGVIGKSLVTPYGVVTPLEDDVCDALEKNASFARMEKKGFVKVLSKNPASVESVAKDMADDKSKQETPKTLGKKAAKTDA